MWISNANQQNKAPKRELYVLQICGGSYANFTLMALSPLLPCFVS